MAHHITPEQLAELTVGYNQNHPVPLSLCVRFAEAGDCPLFYADGGLKHDPTSVVVDPSELIAARTLLDSLDKAGYEVIKKRFPILPRAVRHVESRKEINLMGDPDGIVDLQGKTVSFVDKRILISAGFVSMTMSFTDGTWLSFHTKPTRDGRGQLDVKFVEPV